MPLPRGPLCCLVGFVRGVLPAGATAATLAATHGAPPGTRCAPPQPLTALAHAPCLRVQELAHEESVVVSELHQAMDKFRRASLGEGEQSDDDGDGFMGNEGFGFN